MAIEVFNRYEHKYLLGKDIYEKVLQIMDMHMELDSHSESHKSYLIANIYYDTADDYYLTMLELFYKKALDYELWTADESPLKTNIIKDNEDYLSLMLYEIYKRKIKLLPVNKYRSKEFEFSEYSDNTCTHGILPPLSILS